MIFTNIPDILLAKSKRKKSGPSADPYIDVNPKESMYNKINLLDKIPLGSF